MRSFDKIKNILKKEKYLKLKTYKHFACTKRFMKTAYLSY